MEEIDREEKKMYKKETEFGREKEREIGIEKEKVRKKVENGGKLCMYF